MQSVRVAPDQNGFMLSRSGERFVPWGHNYGIDEFAVSDDWDWGKTESDFNDLTASGANVIRIHLQFPQFMNAPGTPNRAALQRLTHLLRLCEKHRLYLDITGLACYRPDRRAAWYDALSTDDRWQIQAKFWAAIARTCRSSSAVFCYDLMNEPVYTGKRSDGWYTGRLGGYDFLQRLSVDQPKSRTNDEISRAWVHVLVTAIRHEDRGHLITVGELPMFGLPPKAIAPDLDFMAVHIYPKAGKVDAAIDNLKIFAVGKPLVIEETFPLSCGVDDEREFLLKSRGIACGWIGQYPDQSPAELRALKASGKITAVEQMYLGWIDLFAELGPVMKGE
jgi:hypothetical protein